MIQFDDCAYFFGFWWCPKFWSSVFKRGDMKTPPPSSLTFERDRKTGERHGEGWQGMWAEGKSCAAFLLIHVFFTSKIWRVWGSSSRDVRFESSFKQNTKQTNKQTNKRTNERTNEWTNEQTNKQTNVRPFARSLFVCWLMWFVFS